MSFIDDVAPEDEASSYSEYDSQNDILYCYNSDDSLKWIEYYDYNDQGQCIFVKHTLPSGSVLWSYLYEWSGSNLVKEAYFDSQNTLSWFNTITYSGNNPVLKTKYNSGSTLLDFQTWTYSASNKILSTGSYNSSSTLQWAYKYEYDGSDNRTKLSSYGSNSQESASIENEYDGSNRITKATGSGTSISSDSFDAPCKFPSFYSYGGVNKESRNQASLTLPQTPSSPGSPSMNLIDNSLSYAWMSLWFYDAYGYTSATLNSVYLPVELVRVAPEYLNDHPLKTNLTYGNNRLIQNTTSWNNQTVLDMLFSYDSSGYLTKLDTSGRSLYIPLSYQIGYTPKNGFEVPGEIGIYNESTLLQSFVYVYDEPSVSSADEYAKGVSHILHYDGDGQLVGTYTFSYSDPILTISVTDSSANYTGKFEIAYDVDNNIASFTSFNKDGGKEWDYQFDYEGNNRISQAINDENNLPDEGDFFSVESMFVDLNRFFP